MSKIIGTVDFVKRDNKALKLEGGDIWYSSWAAFSGIAKGQEVEMDVVQKPGTGGKIFYNIQPNTLRVTGGTAALPEAGAPGSSPAPAVTVVKAGWPIPKDSARDRCIMRQNAVGNSIKYHELVANRAAGIVEDDIIATARIFESYYSGDLDQAELEVGLEKMSAV